MTREPEVSVLIVNWNTRELTLACLDALPRGVGEEISYDVIVVDNGSADGSAEALAERDDLVLIRNDDNLGFAAAVNQAYRRSTGELVLLLNSDVELIEGAVTTLVRFLRKTPRRGGRGATLRQCRRHASAVSLSVSDLRNHTRECQFARPPHSPRKQTPSACVQDARRRLLEAASRSAAVSELSSSAPIVLAARSSLRRAIPDLLQRRPARTLARGSRVTSSG